MPLGCHLSMDYCTCILRWQRLVNVLCINDLMRYLVTIDFSDNLNASLSIYHFIGVGLDREFIAILRASCPSRPTNREFSVSKSRSRPRRSLETPAQSRHNSVQR